MNVLSRIDQMIRDGRVVEAGAQLRKVTKRGGTPEREAGKVANLYWRVGEPARGVRALARVWGRGAARDWETRPAEACEYAICLAKLGAFDEARAILARPAVAASRQAALYHGFAYLETWDYDRAIAHFETYLRTKSLTAYARRVGLANLAAALVYEGRHSAARPILERLLHDAQLTRNMFMLGYVLGVAAADRVIAREPRRAHRYLAEVEKRWGGKQGFDHFLIEKWRTFTSLLADGAAARPALAAFREKARASEHWETLRDCDRYEALLLGNRDAFCRAYFGTPFPAFRAKLQRDFGRVEIPTRYLRTVGPSGVVVEPIDLDDCGIKGQPLALLARLAADAYRPVRLGTLFAALYPEEHYNRLHTPLRMHEALRRLDAALKKEGSPIFTEQTEGGYRLASATAAGVFLASPEVAGAGWAPLIVRLRERFGERAFSIKEADASGGVPRRTLLRHLQSLAASGHLELTGRGAGTRYRCATVKEE